MTLERLKIVLPFMNALVEGKKVQWMNTTDDDPRWYPILSGSFVNWTTPEIIFRLEPEVREFWVSPDPGCVSDVEHCKGDLSHNAFSFHKEGWIHVREVGE